MKPNWLADAEWHRTPASTATSAQALHKQAVVAEEAARAIDAMRALCEAGEASWEAPLARAESGGSVSTEARGEALKRCAALGLVLPTVAIGRTVKPAWGALPTRPPGKSSGGGA